MSKRKVLAIALSLALAIGSMGMAFAETGVTIPVTGGSVQRAEFVDMPNNWSTAALNKAVENGLLKGYSKGDQTLIKANNSLTRAELAAVVNRAFNATGTADISKVTDVAGTAWYAGDIAKAVKMGTFALDTKMRPNDKITRQEAFAVLARAFKLTGADAEHKALAKFADKADIAAWALKDLDGLAAAGYIQGSGGKLNPKAHITRAEFAVVMDSLVKQYIDEAGTVSQVAASGNVMVRVPGVTLKNVTIKGDLIIADGVGDGDVTLDSVTVEGRTVVRGGGENSIRIIGDSSVQNIIIARVDGQIRVYAEDGTEIGVVVVDGSDDVIMEGEFASVTVLAEGVTVVATSATIASAAIEGENSNIVVGSGSTVNNLSVNGANATVTANAGAQVNNVVINASGATVAGGGTVSNVMANASNATINTQGTVVKAAEGTTGVTAGGNAVAPGTEGAVPRPSTGGGGSGPDTTAPTLTSVTPAKGPVVLNYGENFVLTVDAYDARALAELEVDHSMEGTLPEFSVYANATNPYGSEEDRAAFEDAGVNVTYNASAQKWTIDFGETITAAILENGEITFYLVIKDAADNQWGSMYELTEDNTFAYTVGQAPPPSRVEIDPGNTGGAEANFDQNTKNFSGTIAFYEADEGFPPVAGNYVGVKITAAAEVEVDSENATFRYTNASGDEVTLVNGEDAWLDGGNFVYYYPLVTMERKSFTVMIDWDGEDTGYAAETITIQIDSEAVLERMEEEPNDDVDSAVKIVVDATPRTFWIYPEIDEDWFWFTAEAGTTYEIATSELYPPYEEEEYDAMDTYLFLYDEEGNQLDENDDRNYDEGNLSSVLQYTFTTSGNYYIKVVHYYNSDPNFPPYPQDIGRYDIEVKKVEGEVTDTPEILSTVIEEDHGDLILTISGTAEAGAEIIVRYKGNRASDPSYADGEGNWFFLLDSESAFDSTMILALIGESVSITAQVEGKNISEVHTAVIQVDGIEAEDLDGLVEALNDDEHQVIFIDGLITLNADEEEGVEPLTIPSDKIVIINDEATLASGNVGIVNEGIIIVNGVLQTDPEEGIRNNNLIIIKPIGKLAHAEGGTIIGSDEETDWSVIVIFEDGEITSEGDNSNFEVGIPYKATYFSIFYWDTDADEWAEGGIA